MEQNSEQIPQQAVAPTPQASDKVSLRNLIMFPLGTVGRDFIYNLFNTFLMTFILLTKHLTPAELGAITFIIVGARIFDALNDPIMGGIVENTRSKWGKYKPWQLIGSVLTAGVVIALFCVDLDGWAFIGFLAFIYFAFSITFTMNDISYWGMLPTLSSDIDSRNKLTSFGQIAVGIGAGAAGILVPLFTTGQVGATLFAGAKRAYAILSVVAGAVLIGFQLFTIFGVKEKPLDANFIKTPRRKVKDVFRTILRNDQLMWCAIILLLYNIGTNVVGAGLSTMYLYFEFGYEGILLTVFSIVATILGTVFTLFYPWFSKRLGRDRTLYSTGFCIIAAYLLVMILGLTLPDTKGFDINIGDWHLHLNLKFVLMTIVYGLTGWGGGFYMIMTINMANTVEYNEYKTGKRDEGLIFSLRPLCNKMGSAISVGLVSVVYLIAGVLTTTNAISDVENEYGAYVELTEAQQADKLARINQLLGDVPLKSKQILLCCMCLIPVVFLTVAMIIYKKKCFLNEAKMNEIGAIVAQRNSEEASSAVAGDQAADERTA